MKETAHIGRFGFLPAPLSGSWPVFRLKLLDLDGENHSPQKGRWRHLMCLTCLHFCVRSMGNVAKQPLDVGMKDLLNRTRVCQRENIEWNRACDPVTRSSLFSWKLLNCCATRLSACMIQSANDALLSHVYVCFLPHWSNPVRAKGCSKSLCIVCFIFVLMFGVIFTELYFPHNNFLASSHVNTFEGPVCSLVARTKQHDKS